MLPTKLLRSFAALASAILIASCSESVANPTAPVGAIASHDSGSGDSGSSQASDSTQLALRAVWWKTDHENVQVSQVIGPGGGTISIPATGLTIRFPAGAVVQPLTITVTADEKYVAYKMEPSGTVFLKDVQVTQSLAATSLYGEPLKSPLYAAYIADDNIKLSGNVPVIEIEPSTTIFSALNPALPQAQVWVIRHFSRYMLASN
jgi:hypothetical protein